MQVTKIVQGAQEEYSEEEMPLEAVQGDTGSLHGTDSLFERNSIQEGGEGDRWEEGESVGSSRCSTPVMIDPLQLEYSADPTNTVIVLLPLPCIT